MFLFVIDGEIPGRNMDRKPENRLEGEAPMKSSKGRLERGAKTISKQNQVKDY